MIFLTSIKNMDKEKFFLFVLWLLCVVPLLAGLHRLWLINSEITSADNLRFQADPVPVIIHILSMMVYGPLGATMFSKKLRLRWAKYHRTIGIVLVLTGSFVALSGLWMTQFYPRAGYDGFWVYGLRWIVGLAILFSLAVGVLHLRHRRFIHHGRWMMRAYALSMGAGTQVFTHLPLLIFPYLMSETGRAVSMGLGWLLNLIFVEWFFHKNNQENKRSL